MAHPQTNIRLEPSLKARATAAADTRGITLSELVALALGAYLGAGDTTGDTTGDTLARVGAVEAAITALEARVARVEAGADNATTTPPSPTYPASLSDTALRVRWRKAGGPGSFLDWAQGQGWERDGKGNKAQWHRLKAP